jgi:hypothetical protein
MWQFVSLGNLSSWFHFIDKPKKGKVKCTLVQKLMLRTGRTAHRGSRGIALLFHDHGTRMGWGSASRPGRNLPPGKTHYPLYRRLGGPLGRSGRARKISLPPGYDPRTIQPVASRYTDWATRPRINLKMNHNSLTICHSTLYSMYQWYDIVQ